MKKWIKMLSSVVVVLICAMSAQAQQPMTVKMTKGEAQITAIKGNATLMCAGQKEARHLKKNDRLGAGCEVTTGADSRLEMLLPDRSIVRCAEKTKFKLVQSDISKEGKRAIKMAVPIGKIWTNVRKTLWNRDNKFEVSCQNAVAGIRGTVYRLDVEKDQSALVKVYDGEVAVQGVPQQKQQSTVPAFGPPQPVSGPTAVSGPKPVTMEQWVYIVKSMQQIEVTSDGQAGKPKDFTEAEDMDDWVKWNKQRDERHGQ